MWTAPNKKYYDIIRAEECKRRSRLGGGAAASRGPATATSSFPFSAASAPVNAASRAAGLTAGPTVGGTGGRTQQQQEVVNGALPTSRPTDDPTLEEPLKILDPVTALKLERTAIMNVKELAFNHRGITGLHENMMRFENLEVLSLQHNRLKSLRNLLPRVARAGTGREGNGEGGDPAIAGTVAGPFLASVRSEEASASPTSTTLQQLTGPRGCFRLKRLLLAGNRLRQLGESSTDIPRLGSLEYLNVSGNQLCDLDAVIQVLRSLKRLTYLDLEGNPICEDPCYRRRVIASLPQVLVLDRVAITHTERRDACAAEGGTHPAAPEPSAAPRVAFGSTLSGSDTGNGHQRSAGGAPWAKSQCVKLMEKRCKSHAQQRAAAAAAEAEAKSQELAEAVNVKQGFHAAWALSRAGMPLSSSSGAPTQDGAPEAPTSDSTRKPSSAAAVVGGARGSPSAGSNTVGVTAAHGTTLPVLAAVSRSISDELALPSPLASAEAYRHEGALYDALLGHDDIAKEKELRALSSTNGPVAAVGAPPPERLAELGAAITEASTLVKILAEQRRGQEPTQQTAETAKVSARGGGSAGSQGPRHRTGSRGSHAPMKSAPSPPPMPDSALPVVSAALQPARPPSASSGSGGAQGPTPQTLVAALRAKGHAFIPPPWEGLSPSLTLTTASESMSPAHRTYVVAEKLDAIVEAVSALFLPQELQALEARFGACELINAVRLFQGSSFGGGGSPGQGPFLAMIAAGSSAGSAAVGGSAAGRRSPPGGPGATANKRPSSVTGRKSMRSTAAMVAAAAEAESSREALWTSVTTAITIAAAPPAAASAIGGSSAGSVAAPAGGSAGGSGGMNTCVVGPFAATTLASFLSELQQKSGAWDLPTEPLLASLFTAYGVDPVSGMVLKPAVVEAAGGSGDGDGSGGGGPAAGGRPGRGGGGAGATGKPSALRGRKSGHTDGSNGSNAGGDALTARDRLGGAGTADSTAGGGTGKRPTAPGAARTPTAASLTVNHLLTALVCYEPFLQQRIRFLDSKCVEATNAALRSSTVAACAINPMTAPKSKTGRQARQHQHSLSRTMSSSSDDDDVDVGGQFGADSAATGDRNDDGALRSAGAPSEEEKEASVWFSRLQKARVTLRRLQAAQAGGKVCGAPAFEALSPA